MGLVENTRPSCPTASMKKLLRRPAGAGVCHPGHVGLPLRAEEATPSPEIALAKLTDEILFDDFHLPAASAAVGLGLAPVRREVRGLSARPPLTRKSGRLHARSSPGSEAIDASRRLERRRRRSTYKLLRLGIDNGLLQIGEMGTYDRNPITYAGALWMSTSTSSAISPRSPTGCAASSRSSVRCPRFLPPRAKTSRKCCPDPFFELALDIARGNADFLDPRSG